MQTIKQKLDISVLTLAGLLLLAVLIGLVAAVRLTGLLGYISGPAWETADGAMEGNIGLQSQLLALDEIYYAGHNSALNNQLDEGKALADEALGRMMSSGLLAEGDISQLNRLLDDFHTRGTKLYDDSLSYQTAKKEFSEHFFKFQNLMTEAEELGDAQVEFLENNPNELLSWRSGLSARWAAADGGMESQIHLLSAQYYFNRYLTEGRQSSDRMAGIESMALLGSTINEITELSVFRNSRPTSAGYESMAFAQAMSQSFSELDRLSKVKLESFDALTKTRLDYLETVEALTSLIEEVEETADGQVEGQLGAIQTTKFVVYSFFFLIFVAGVAGTLLIFRFVRNEIISPLLELTASMASAAEGSLTIEHDHSNRQDELGAMAQALSTFIEYVRKGKQLASENERVSGALKVADTPVMLADTDMCITYVNEAAQDLMDFRSAELKTVLPAFNNHQLVGTNVDAFHKDPSHQRRLLGSLTETYRSQIKVAGLTFNLTATPLFGESGDRLGTVIEWGDVTEELAKSEELQRIAQENARIRQALDNVTTNTMIADGERNIVYINKSVHKMLKGRERALQAVLPNFNADKLIGETMDVFHKNPAHQKGLLEALKDTHRAQIQVADLHFGLTANPVYDDDGNRIGSVVEWQDMTEEVNIRTEIDNLIKSASHGDLTQRIPIEGKSGFFANLSEGLNQLVQISEGVVADTARVFSALSHGDLTETIEQHYEGAFGELKNDANATVNKLTEIITQIREAAGTVSTGADEIAQGNTDLSQRTEEQASSLEETASSMEEMTSAVKSSADNAMQANEIARQTQKLASSGGSVVQDAVRAMGEINESSKHIADIIGVIDEIAFQTNLLALNAAVEAARAGEQGRGFAVVASEVRNLAQRSAAAAKEIKDLIRDSVDKVTTGSDLVNKSGETLEEIVASVQKVSSMVEDISGSAHEQSSGIEQVNKAVSQMDEMTQQNAALVEEASAAGEAMAEQARKLMQQMAFFTLANDGVKRSSMATSTPAPAAQPAPVASSKPASTAPVPENTKPVSSQGGMEVSDDDDDWEEF